MKPPNTEMEPTRQLVSATVSLRRAAHFARSADDALRGGGRNVVETRCTTSSRPVVRSSDHLLRTRIRRQGATRR